MEVKSIGLRLLNSLDQSSARGSLENIVIGTAEGNQEYLNSERVSNKF